ncbi:hypothetical protein BDV95DRAFT_562366 [Massariosphaeria phaeospora]|uniref:DNA replication factor Cdt1 C-terminal domain-containing protein n=1 Tax=Massariosphaeria phaeospora TaxID=100035 RepID=A0A7C8IE51_9PLEO|nr:hypothetical protein BDV95DRAFT_562366 [Massariosphaeria phaeospora]
MHHHRADHPLPEELADLVSLHSSFLTALSIQYAHNGNATPVDLRDLTQSVSTVWKRRQVTFDDIRLCLGIIGCGPAGHNQPFLLSDYGCGKICLELCDELKTHEQISGPLKTDALQLLFMQGLEKLWVQWNSAEALAPQLFARPIAKPKRRGRSRKVDPKQTTLEPTIDAKYMRKFIADLPRVEITACSSLAAVAPLQEKGKKRLREVKDSVQQGQTQKKVRFTADKENAPAPGQTPPAQPVQTKMTDFASVRKTNLLDRILAKQAAAAAGPTPPSPAELQRQAALQRAEEMLGVLSLLCATKGPGPRVSFSMASLIQSLQGSSRSPISKDEALKCVEVLSNEVTPGYVSVVRMGTMSSVVINQGMRPVDVKGRLAALGVA